MSVWKFQNLHVNEADHTTYDKGQWSSVEDPREYFKQYRNRTRGWCIVHESDHLFVMLYLVDDQWLRMIVAIPS